MILWKLNALRQKSENESLDLTFLAEGKDETTVRSIMQQYGFIILSLESFTQDIAQFGNIWVRIQWEDGEHMLVVNSESYEKACAMFLEAGCVVTAINDTSNTLRPEQGDQIITGVKKNVLFAMEQEKQAKTQEAQAEQQKFVSKSREKLIGIVEQTFEDIANIKSKLTGSPYVSGSDFKQLYTLEEELKKLRMGSNTDKITQILQEIFTLMEKLEIQHIDALKEEEKQGVLATSLVSDLDVAGELDKYKKAQRVANAGTAKTAEDTYYIFFGKLGMYVRFLTKDVKNKFAQIRKILVGILDYLMYTSVFFAIVLGGYSMYASVFSISLSQQTYVLFVYAGVAGLAITLGSIITTKNILTICIRVIASFALYVVCINFVLHTFALQ